MSRRELLAAFLGLPAALACERARRAGGRERPLPPGEIVGASDRLGHRLRDAPPPTVPADRWQRLGVVVVGAGAAGLSAAWRLLRAGVRDFVVLELEPVPGGTARSGRSALCGYPWGAHYVPAPLRENRTLCTLLGEMGVLDGVDEDGQPRVAEEHLCRDPEERVFYRGRWYEGLYLRAGASRQDLAELARFRAEIDRLVAWRDGHGRRAFAIPIASGSDDPEITGLDRISMAAWLEGHGLRSPRLRWLCDYACRDDYGLRLGDTSAWAGLFYFASRLLRPGAEARPLLTWPEGNGRLIAHLGGRAHERLALGLAAAALVPRDRGVDVVAVDASGAARGFRAEQVICAAPQFLAARLCAPWRAAPPAHAGDFQYGAWMVANLHLRDRPGGLGFPLAWDNVLYDSPGLGYVVATHQADLERGPTVFTYYHPLCDADPRTARARLLATDRDGWAEIALADLGRAHPDLRALTSRLDVMRWGHAMIRPTPGFVWGAARAAAARPFRGIHFANTDLSGVALFEEALWQGVRAAEEVLAARGRLEGSLL